MRIQERPYHDLPSLMELPLWIRNDVEANEEHDRGRLMERARIRRVVRKHSLANIVLGGALVGGASAAFILSFFVAKSGVIPTVGAAVVALFGYHLVVTGCEEYMAATRTYEDATATST